MPFDDEARRELAVGLRAVIGRLGRRLNASAATEGLTPSQASVLQVLSVRGAVKLADLATIEGINPTMLSRIVSKLDEAGLLRRLPDPEDLRAVRVEATEDGLRLSQQVREARSRVVAEALATIPESAQLLLRDALPALSQLGDALS